MYVAKVYEAFVNGRTNEDFAEGAAVAHEQAIDVNARRFGAYSEPLLCVLARLGKRRALDALLASHNGASLAQKNQQGRSAVFLAFDSLRCRTYHHDAEEARFTPSRLRELLLETEGEETIELLTSDYVLKGEWRALETLLKKGQPDYWGKGLLLNLPLLNMAVTSRCAATVQLVLDCFKRNPVEVFFKTPRLSPEIREVLLDAGADCRERDLAVMMAFHPRLGQDAQLGRIQDLVRRMVLPFTVRRKCVEEVRSTRVLQLIGTEALSRIDTTCCDEYVTGGGLFMPAHFRLSHVLNLAEARARIERVGIEKGTTTEMARILIKRRLDDRGLHFDVPLTPAYTAAAIEAMEHPIPEEDYRHTTSNHRARAAWVQADD